MSLELVKIHGHGKQNEEVVELSVLKDCDLSKFMIADTTFGESEKSISNKLRHIYWFATKEVKKGDYVLLYTGKGKNESYDNQGGTKTHKIHWGLNMAVWNDAGDLGILFSLQSWTRKKAG
jgi:hypothetical protein